MNKNLDFMQTIPDSQFYTDLDMILYNLELLKQEQENKNKGPVTTEIWGIQYVVLPNSDPITLDSIIVGMKNTIQRGYKMISTERSTK
jgi:hypothetical protein